MSTIRLDVESTDDGKIVIENVPKRRRYEVILIPADSVPDPTVSEFARLSNAVFAEIWDNDEDAVYDKYLPK